MFHESIMPSRFLSYPKIVKDAGRSNLPEASESEKTILTTELRRGRLNKRTFYLSWDALFSLFRGLRSGRLFLYELTTFGDD